MCVCVRVNLGVKGVCVCVCASGTVCVGGCEYMLMRAKFKAHRCKL